MVTQQTQRMWQYGKKPIVIAHRGGGNEAPENSLSAFANMDSKNFRYIETDSHATSDGVVILMHDANLARTTNTAGKISSFTWSQILDVADESGNHPVRLEDALKGFPHLIYNIDAKDQHVVRPLIKVLKRCDALDRVSLSSFNETRLKYLRRKLPGVRTSLGRGAIAWLVISALLPQGLGWRLARAVPGVKHGVEAIQVPIIHRGIPVLTPRLIDLCHARQQAVHVWTINDPQAMRTLVRLGVDAIITDEPSLAQEVIDDEWNVLESLHH
ncbi:glycerophosphodiester phosphodiesterase [Arcanobacterium bovis]|uniref:Glycerophosphodiester phosphodiesterase n=1 Tax=Arcanobacterium bovis TaxID=2529275 RepID=A0A4Q9UZW0_9ACTO|nr:glycerophosphodiester phosphodiesterase [Arcanobacterium bovis]TBW21554.1 glycerophosphodiester phosphodiesterase [Arcanobacterium bovis]